MLARNKTNKSALVLCGATLVFILLGAGPLVAGNSGAYKQKLGNATIDWFNYTISAVGKGELPMMEMKWDKAEKIATRKALMHSRYNLLQTMEKLRIHRDLLVGDLFRKNRELAANIRGEIHNSRLVKKSVENNQFVHVVTEMKIDSDLLGQLIPSGVWYEDKGGSLAEDQLKDKVLSEQNKDYYTGVIVDARNLSAEPSLILRLSDQEGNVIYGPGTVDRHYALEQGMAMYVRNKSAARKTDRVGRNPLSLRAIEVVENATCDLVLPSVEAEQLQGLNRKTNLLNESRLAIILQSEDDDGLVEYNIE